MRTFLLRLFIAICLPALSFNTGIAQRVPEISDMEAAMQYCAKSQLEGPEGVWEFVEDEAQVLIRRAPLGGKGYDIIVISTSDCRLHAGDIIGHMNPSSKKGKYRLSLHTSRVKSILSGTRDCVAEYSDNDDSILVHPVKLKISMRTMWFLPKFWRSLRFSFSNPAADLPEGLVRIYPRTKPRSPIYL